MNVAAIASRFKPSALLNGILNTPAATKLFNPKVAGAAATIALISTQSKDALGTYYYVTQSLKNKKIPEEKRKFVAGLDLANGILNQAIAFPVGLLLGAHMPKVFDAKIAPKYFSKEAMEAMFKKINPANMDIAKFAQKFDDVKGLSKAGLAVIATLVGTQIICKRVIVPLLATPMASFFKKKMEKAGGENTPAVQRAIIDTTMPIDKPVDITDFKGYLKNPTA